MRFRKRVKGRIGAGSGERRVRDRWSVEALETRTLLNGLVVVAHGLELLPGRPGWLDAYANAIAVDDGPGTMVYQLRVQADSNNHLSVASFSKLSGPASMDASTFNGDVVLELDWSAVSASIGTAALDTAAVASLVTPYIEGTASFNYGNIGITHSLVEGTVQLIGHSRGASLVSQIAANLGTNGILVDQLTTLDPVPVSPDPDVVEWGNVIFADNYYETNSLTPGKKISGAYNVGALNLPGQYDEGFPGNLITGGQHQNVELFYEGTIDTTDPAGDGDKSVVDSWYTNNHVDRETTGFYYSAMEGGTRPLAGISTAFGGTASRSGLTFSGFQWPNVTTLSVPLDTIFLGQNFNVTYRYFDTVGNTTITWYLDTDQNPYNNNGTQIGTNSNLAATGQNVIKTTSAMSSGNVPAGVYYLEAKISNGDAVRYAYTTPLSVQEPPVIGVTGNGTVIPSGDTTVSSTDGTDFGTLTPGQGSVTETFTITNTGAGPLIFQGQTPITVTGTNAKDWVVTQPVITQDGTSSTFTVTYDPATVGFSAATIHIASNDPTNSDYTFVVNGVNPPFIDFGVTLASSKIPATTTSGNGQQLQMTLAVKNLGNSAVPSNAPLTTIKIYARDPNGVDTLVTTQAGVNLRGLGAGVTKNLTVNFTLLAGFAAGTYTFHAVLNEDADITETNNTNNAVTTVQAAAVTMGFYDLSGFIASTTIPAAVVDNTAINKSISVTIQNLGNIAIPTTNPSNQSVILTVTAVPDVGDPVTLYTSPSESIAGLAAGKTKTFGLTIKDLAGLPDGNYTLEVQITPTPAMNEVNTANNLITTNGAGNAVRVVSAPPFVDLTATLGATKFPVTTLITGGGTKVSIPLTIQNIGNIPVPTNAALMTIQIFAHNTVSGDETLATTVGNVNLRSLAANGTRTMTLTPSLPIDLASGTYTFHVVIDAGSEIAESTTANDNATTVQSVTATRGFYDLTGTIASTTLPPAVVNGAAINNTISVSVSNLGNVAIPSNEQVKFTVTLTGVDPDNSVTLAASSAMSVAGLKNGSAKTLSVPVKIPGGLATDDYTISIQMDPVQAIPEDSTLNNTITQNAIGNAVTVISAPAFLNVGGTLGSSTLSSTYHPNTGFSGSLKVTVENMGNTNFASGQKMTLQVFAVNTSDTTATALSGLTTISVGSWKPGQNSTYTLSAKDTLGLALGQYDLEVVITPVPVMVESNAGDDDVLLTPHGDNVAITIV